MSNLTVSQRESIRQIVEEGKTTTGRFNTLCRNGYASRSPQGEMTLTPKGERAHKQIMSSGDGPERLKAMFRF